MSKATDNNNPGNLEDPQDNWQGETGSDGVYVVFSSPMWGFRALYKDIYNKITKDGNNTLLSIFEHYLSVGNPPDNHTDDNAIDYANEVAQFLPGTGINDTLTADETTLKAIAHGIARQESGNDASIFTETDYNNGYLLFKGEQVATSPVGIGTILLIGGGIWYLVKKKRTTRP